MTAEEYTHQALQWANTAMQFARRLGGTQADSEDAVQEALLSLWQQRDNVDATHGRSYLLSSTYRQMMSLFRRHATEQAHSTSLPSMTTQQPNTVFDLREAIDRCMQTLSPQQRAVMQLRDVEGYSFAEIASTMDMTENNVQVHLFRARVNMRKQLIAMGYDNNQQ